MYSSSHHHLTDSSLYQPMDTQDWSVRGADRNDIAFWPHRRSQSYGFDFQPPGNHARKSRTPCPYEDPFQRASSDIHRTKQEQESRMDIHQQMGSHFLRYMSTGYRQRFSSGNVPYLPHPTTITTTTTDRPPTTEPDSVVGDDLMLLNLQQHPQQHDPTTTAELVGLTLATRKSEVKHPLESTWCLFMLQDAERRTVTPSNEIQIEVHEVHEFSTVEDFWCMVNHIHPPSTIGVSEYSLFKKGIKPTWEDSALHDGGRWITNLPIKLQLMDEIWWHLSMAMIGESLFGDYNQNICGAVVSVRPHGSKLALWINCKDFQSATFIGSQFRSILSSHLEIHDCQWVGVMFQSFKDSVEYSLRPLMSGVNTESTVIDKTAIDSMQQCNSNESS